MQTYKSAEETIKAYYVVVDVGQTGKKAKALIAARNDASNRGDLTSPIIFIDGARKPSASKLR